METLLSLIIITLLVLVSILMNKVANVDQKIGGLNSQIKAAFTSFREEIKEQGATSKIPHEGRVIDKPVASPAPEPVKEVPKVHSSFSNAQTLLRPNDLACRP